MKKISSKGSGGIIVKFFIKAVLLTAVSAVLISLLISAIVYKADIDLKYLEYFSIGAAAVCSTVISYFSVKSFKNSGFLMGILSCVPLMIYSFVNLLINGGNIVFFLIKLAVIIILSGLFGYISIKKSKKIKVK